MQSKRWPLSSLPFSSEKIVPLGYFHELYYDFRTKTKHVSWHFRASFPKVRFLCAAEQTWGLWTEAWLSLHLAGQRPSGASGLSFPTRDFSSTFYALSHPPQPVTDARAPPSPPKTTEHVPVTVQSRWTNSSWFQDTCTIHRGDVTSQKLNLSAESLCFLASKFALSLYPHNTILTYFDYLEN